MRTQPVIVFDLFGVVLSKGLESSIRRLEVALNRSASDIAPVYEALEQQFDIDLIDETKFWHDLNRALGTNVNPRALSRIVLSGYYSRPASFALLHRLNAAFDLYLYTNYRREWFDRLNREFGLSSHFKRMYVSSDTKLLKPDPQVLLHLSADIGRPVTDFIVIDDERPNVRMATTVGALGVLHRSAFETDAFLHTVIGDSYPAYDAYYAGVLLQSPIGALILQRRDNLPEVSNPNSIAVFGGRFLPGETAIDCAVRELQEETDLSAAPEDLVHLISLGCPIENGRWMHCTIYKLTNVDVDAVTIREGQGVEVMWPEEARDHPDVRPPVRLVIARSIDQQSD